MAKKRNGYFDSYVCGFFPRSIPSRKIFVRDFEVLFQRRFALLGSPVWRAPKGKSRREETTRSNASDLFTKWISTSNSNEPHTRPSVSLSLRSPSILPNSPPTSSTPPSTPSQPSARPRNSAPRSPTSRASAPPAPPRRPCCTRPVQAPAAASERRALAAWV